MALRGNRIPPSLGAPRENGDRRPLIFSRAARMPLDGGSYVLILRVKRASSVKVGRLGEIDFPKGYYAYMGSALGGLSARVGRHLRKEGKKICWHIDYLLASPGVSLVQVLTVPGKGWGECHLTRRMAALPGASVISPGFGSSDCRKGCPSHLIYLNGSPRSAEVLASFLGATGGPVASAKMGPGVLVIPKALSL